MEGQLLLQLLPPLANRGCPGVATTCACAGMDTATDGSKVQVADPTLVRSAASAPACCVARRPANSTSPAAAAAAWLGAARFLLGLSATFTPAPEQLQDLDAYTSVYAENTKLKRLLFIADHCPQLAAEALR